MNQNSTSSELVQRLLGQQQPNDGTSDFPTFWKGIKLLDACFDGGQDLPACRPGRLWSLLEMEEELSKIAFVRETIRSRFHRFLKTQDTDRALTRTEGELFKLEMAEDIKLFQRHGFKAAELAADKLALSLASPKTTVGGLAIRVTELEENLKRDLWSKRVIYVIDEDLAGYFDASFGPVVSGAFSDATVEIREAQSCLALGRNTACVFHLMRGVEHGLRALSVAVGRPVGKLPFDYEEWSGLIDGIDVEWKTAVDTWGKSAEQINARQFFKRLSADMHAFKDDVRNVTAHTRKTFDEPGALSVRNRVRDWFEILATKAHDKMTARELLDRTLFAP